MPHSPVTRFLAFLVVAVAAILLLWPGEIQAAFGLILLGMSPLLVAVFTWSAVRDAPPFDTNAFHRTLPGGNREGFCRVLGMHAWVFAGISLLLLAYAAIYNVGWPDFLYSLFVVLLPLMAICGLTGTLEALGGAGRGWRIPAWLVMLLLYGGSIAAAVMFPASKGSMGLGRDGEPIRYYLPGVRCGLLAAAFGFPFCWWLVAVCRRKLSGFLGLVLTGASLPWVVAYVDFFPAPVPHPELLEPSYIGATRKPLDKSWKGWGRWPAVAEMLEPTGLQEGEFGRIESMALPPGDFQEGGTCWFAELPAEAWVHGSVPTAQRTAAGQHQAWFGKSGGRIVWGEAGLWEHLASQLPAHQSLERFDRKAEGTRAEWPGTSLGCFLGNDEAIDLIAQRPWNLQLRGPVHWEAIGSCKAASGARFRLAQGGVLDVAPLAVDYWKATLAFSYRGTRFAPGPAWFGKAGGSTGPRELMLLLMDESGTRAYALGSTHWDGSVSSAMDPRERQFWSAAPEDTARVNLLRGGTLYLFQPVWTRTQAGGVFLFPP